jgi:hypothetical protein
VVLTSWCCSTFERSVARKTGDGWLVTARVKNVGTGTMPIEVAATAGALPEEGRKAEKYVDARTPLTLAAGQEMAVSIPRRFKPEKLTVDPDVLVLQLERDKATVPIKISDKPAPGLTASRYLRKPSGVACRPPEGFVMRRLRSACSPSLRSLHLRNRGFGVSGPDHALGRVPVWPGQPRRRWAGRSTVGDDHGHRDGLFRARQGRGVRNVLLDRGRRRNRGRLAFRSGGLRRGHLFVNQVPERIPARS